MSLRTIRIIEGGFGATLQDGGRHGYRRFGVPTSGAIDAVSWRLANALAAAPEGAAAIELRVGGLTLEVEAEHARVAYVGAPAMLRVVYADDREDREFPAGPTVWPGLALRRGDRLTVGRMHGAAGYVSVDGGLDCEPVLGSGATSLKSGFGGWQGRMLKAGDRLPLGDQAARPLEDLAIRYDLSPPKGAAILRAVQGPQDDCFTDAALDRFFSTEWRISGAADRMGMRLDGPTLEHRNGHDIASDGIVVGAVQVPGDGRPILLLADCGTTGGYPKMACVITADLALAGRLGPGATVRFERATAAQGVAALRAQHAAVAKAIEDIEPFIEPGSVDLKRLYEENLVTVNVVDGEDR